MRITKFKSLTALILGLSLIFSTFSSAESTDPSAYENITVTLNGIQVSFDVMPYLSDDNRTMVEARAISETLGANISWNGDTQTVSIETDDTLIQLVIGQSAYTINGEEKEMDTLPLIIRGRTMVPIRFVSEALGQKVDWDASKKTVRITNENKYTYTIVTTGQSESYDKDGNIIDPSEGESYYGQDADYTSAEFSFTDNGDGTVTDNNTGLMWEQIPMSGHLTYSEALKYCENLELGGYDDWRLPTNKELFNLSDFSTGWPFLDQYYFEFATDTFTGMDNSPQNGSPQDGSPQANPPIEGSDKAAGAQLVASGTEDSTIMPPPPTSGAAVDDGTVSKSEGQFWTEYYLVGTTHGDAPSAFGVNQATGHIKAYPAETSGMMGKYVRAVRGDATSCQNDFLDNLDGTVTDEATGLMWMQDDAGIALEWQDALAYAESFEYAGYDDWRLPDVKELQSIVDYSGVYPAIDSDLFKCSKLEENEFYYYWTSTSAYFSTELPDNAYAWYVAFGYAVDDQGNDTHGAGAVRFSPKYEESAYAGEGGDNILNSIRLVRNLDQ